MQAIEREEASLQAQLAQLQSGSSAEPGEILESSAEPAEIVDAIV